MFIRDSFYIAGVYIHFNDRLGKLKISDNGIRLRDETVIENFFSKRIPICGVLGGGYNKDFDKWFDLDPEEKYLNCIFPRSKKDYKTRPKPVGGTR